MPDPETQEYAPIHPHAYTPTHTHSQPKPHFLPYRLPLPHAPGRGGVAGERQASTASTRLPSSGEVGAREGGREGGREDRKVRIEGCTNWRVTIHTHTTTQHTSSLSPCLHVSMPPFLSTFQSGRRSDSLLQADGAVPSPLPRRPRPGPRVGSLPPPLLPLSSSPPFPPSLPPFLVSSIHLSSIFIGSCTCPLSRTPPSLLPSLPPFLLFSAPRASGTNSSAA